jgi:branched-chain amino acid transport system substrate-binding protein
VEHRHEPRGRADLQQIRLPASRRDGELQPLARDGEALAEPDLLARPAVEIIDGLVDTLDTLRKDGKIGNKVAMAAVGDQFGIEQSTAAREGFKKAGFELVYDKSYPFGTQDLQPIVKDAQAGNPDVFIAFSYPPDTIGLTDQAKIAGFSPKVFFVGVGTAFPLFKQKFGASAEA